MPIALNSSYVIFDASHTLPKISPALIEKRKEGLVKQTIHLWWYLVYKICGNLTYCMLGNW